MLGISAKRQERRCFFPCRSFQHFIPAFWTDLLLRRETAARELKFSFPGRTSVRSSVIFAIREALCVQISCQATVLSMIVALASVGHCGHFGGDGALTRNHCRPAEPSARHANAGGKKIR